MSDYDFKRYLRETKQKRNYIAFNPQSKDHNEIKVWLMCPKLHILSKNIKLKTLYNKYGVRPSQEQWKTTIWTDEDMKALVLQENQMEFMKKCEKCKLDEK